MGSILFLVSGGCFWIYIFSIMITCYSILLYTLNYEGAHSMLTQCVLLTALVCSEHWSGCAVAVPLGGFPSILCTLCNFLNCFWVLFKVTSFTCKAYLCSAWHIERE